MRLSARYSEMRWQPYWVLALSVLMTGSLGIAYGSLLTGWFGWLTGAFTTAAAVAVWWRLRSPIHLCAEELQVGRMRLPLWAVGEVTALDREAFRERVGRGGRADDVFSLAGRRAGGVVVEVTDPTDPFGHWVLGSRRPVELAAAIRNAVAERA